MFSVTKSSSFTESTVLIEAVCLSTDSKPTTGIANGSTIIEMNTGKVYMYNEESGEWEEVANGGGGGGGSGAYPGYDVVFTTDNSVSEAVPQIAKGTYVELVEELTSGTPINGAYLGYNSGGFNSNSFVYSFSYDPDLNIITISIHDFETSSNFALELHSDNTITWAE